MTRPFPLFENEFEKELDQIHACGIAMEKAQQAYQTAYGQQATRRARLVEKIMKKHGLSSRELADYLRVGESTVRNWLRKDRNARKNAAYWRLH